MSKVTVETINGKKYTVVWWAIVDAIEDGEEWCIDFDGLCLIRKQTNGIEFLAAKALPALPRHPKPEDAPLLHRYAAEGLTLMADGKYYPELIEVLSDKIRRWNWEITHATHNGERVEIAIEDEV